MARCGHVKSDGERCRANAVHDSASCFFHSPEKAAERTAARRTGGRANRAGARSTVSTWPLTTSSEVASLLAETINHVRCGELDSKDANAVGYLCTVMLKALEQGDVQEQLVAIENVLCFRTLSQPAAGDPSMKHLVERSSA